MLQGRGICDIIKNMSIFYYIIKVALHMRSPAVNSIIMYRKNAVNVLPKLSKYNPLRIKELK